MSAHNYRVAVTDPQDDRLPHEALGAAWRKARPRPAGRHLDSAACSRQSHRALEAAAHHSRHEAELGGYVAEAASDDLLQQGRSVIGGLVGMAAADVAFVESAQAALVALLTGWRLPAGSRVACLPGEYAPNVAQLRTYGLRPEPLPVDGRGRADVEGIARLLADDPPTFVHLLHIGSHRGLLQPAAEVAALCREAGVPLVLDAAQSMGHADTDLGADVVYGTSRKWLAGPRGVGVLCVRPALAAQLTPVLPEPEGVAPMRAFESGEAHVAGRVGLVVAVGEHIAAGPHLVRERLGAIGRAARELLDGVGGWRVIEPVDEPTATTTLAPPDGIDVVGTRTRLLTEHGIVVSAIGPERAPGEMTGPVLRVSPHVDCTVEDLEALASAL
jgi:pyridoxal 5-phosphate dependent beta-lyase